VKVAGVLYAPFITARRHRRRTFRRLARNKTVETETGDSLMDVVLLAAGLALFAGFGLYAVFLRRV
jgi:hypothetical protein